ncbi:MAG: M81 family peptidase [Alphaproteobacteria bacterium]|nr:M81 family peptidase [Alphaproteobacteria bacterium]
MRVLIAMMKHETNTFSPVPTDLDRFRAWGLQEGDEVIRAYADTRMPVAAYLKLAREAGAEVVTPLAAEAMPSGPVHKAAYEYMAERIVDAAKGCDAALLDLHGAMVAEHLEDGEGVLLERLRAAVPGLPIAVTCDLHCNLTDRMIANSTALIGYKTYPHVDLYEVAEQVGRILFRSLSGECRPIMAWGQAPLLSQTLRQGTDDEPMRSLIEAVRAAETERGVLAATVFGGFALADIRDAGTSAVVVADGNSPQAAAVRDRLLAMAWASREEFVYRHEPIERAVARAKMLTIGPVILLDHADNCGSGGTQDAMTSIAEVVRQGLDDVIVGAVWDPAAVSTMQRAGVGARVTIELGGKTVMPSVGLRGRPLTLSGTVRALTDGEWIVRGPMYTGVKVQMGPSAVLDTGKMRIVVVSRHHEPWDQGVFTSVGISPAHARYILLKSRIHYRAGFSPLAKATITLDGDGVTTSDNSVLRYERVRRPIYPLDRINTP